MRTNQDRVNSLLEYVKGLMNRGNGKKLYHIAGFTEPMLKCD